MVEINSTGKEILLLRLAMDCCFLVVWLRLGISEVAASTVFKARLVVKALPSDDILDSDMMVEIYCTHRHGGMLCPSSQRCCDELIEWDVG